MRNNGKKLLIILISLSMVIGLVWILIPAGRPAPHGNTPPSSETQKALDSIVQQIQSVANTYENNKKLLSDIKATEPLYIWGRGYAEETKNILKQTPQWKTLGEVDEKRAGQIMNSASSTLEDRLYAMSMGYLSMFEELIASGKGTIGTIDMGNSSISGIDALIRARAGAYTLVDWHSVMEKTSTEARVKFIRDKAKDWENAYNNLKTLLILNDAKPKSLILDIGSTYIAIYNLKNITTNTYKNASDILQGTSPDVKLENMDKSTMMFMLYSSEYARVGIEVLSTLKQMESISDEEQTLSKEDITRKCKATWDSIAKQFNISFPEDPTSTTGLATMNKINDTISQHLGIGDNTIGYILINRMTSNYERYKKVSKDKNPDIMFMFYLTAQAQGIARFLTNHTDIAQGILLSAPTSSQNISSSLQADKLTFDKLYQWEIGYIEKTYKSLKESGSYPLIFDTFVSASAIGYKSQQLLPKMKEVIANVSKNNELEVAKNLVGLFTRFMIDNLYNLMDILTIDGAQAILSN